MKFYHFHLFTVVFLYFVRNIEQKSIIETRPDLTRDYGLALEAIFGIGIRLQVLLDSSLEENFIVSPISATVVIGQLMLGAEGEFQEKLYELLSLPNNHIYKNDRIYYKNKNNSQYLPYSTLHLQLSSLLRALEGNSAIAKQFILKQKNAVFVNERMQLKDGFSRNLKSFYEADLYTTMNFLGDPLSCQRFINNWASQNTNGLIKSFLNTPPSPYTSSIFANAIYFLGEWETPFSDILNRNGPFNVTRTKSVDVTYMMGNMEQILYAEAETYRLIALPYKNNELTMYILLPNPGTIYEYNLKEFGQNLKSKDLLDVITNARLHEVIVKIPKMSLSNTINILEPLQKYSEYKKQNNEINVSSRIKDVLDKLDDIVDDFSSFNTQNRSNSNIYLNNAAVNRNLEVSSIVQQVIFAINEKGTEAAAVTAGLIDYIGGSKSFIINKPFMFFIRHEATSVALFWGAVSNPAA